MKTMQTRTLNVLITRTFVLHLACLFAAAIAWPLFAALGHLV